MKVLVLHSELGVLWGGGETFTTSLFVAFARRGHRVTAAFVADPPRPLSESTSVVLRADADPGLVVAQARTGGAISSRLPVSPGSSSQRGSVCRRQSAGER